MATLVQKLQALATKRVFFGHQSVGNNLIYGNAGAVDYGSVGRKGFDQLFKDNPSGGLSIALSGPAEAPLTDSQILGWDPGEWCEVEIGTNGSVTSKVNAFHTLMDRFAALNRLPDYAGFKTCFADFGETWVESDWTTYASVMDGLEAAYPGRIIYWTGALTPHPDANEGAADIVRHEFNRRIRERYGSTGRVFDFAAKERVDSLGRLMTVANIPGMAWEWSATWNPAWDNVNPVYPGGGLDAHPNNNFVNRGTTAYIDFLYDVATRSAMTTASRTTGVAPLGVFFDAVNDVAATPTDQFGRTRPTYAWTSGVVQPSDKEGTHYAWSFGDGAAGTFALTTGKTKGSATGFEAAHVYEEPGVYDVTLDVTDTSGVSTYYRQTIVVSDFAGTTRYLAQGGTGDGTSTSSPWGNLDTAMAWVVGGSSRRLLIRRGDTFTTSGQWNIRMPGPNIIGAYADGTAGHLTTSPRPIINCSYSGSFSVIQPYLEGADWRVMDLDMRSTDTDPRTHDNWSASVGPPSDQPVTDLLVLRLRATQFMTPVGWDEYSLSDRVFLHEIEVPSAPYNVGMYIGGRRISIQGCYVKDCTATHVMRVWRAHKGVIANNWLHYPGGTGRHCLKLHGPAPLSIYEGMPETRWVVVADNEFRANTTVNWTLSMGSQSTSPDEACYVRHLVVERNVFYSPPKDGSLCDIETEANNLVIRNNIFNDSPSTNIVSVVLGQRNPSLTAPNDVRVYNNTTYKSSAATGNDPTGFCQVGAEVTNARIRNNFYGTASTANKDMIVSTGGTGWAADHNVMSTAPGFTNAAGGDYTLVAGSPAIDAGAVLAEVREDYARTLRAGRGASYDLGAFESGAITPQTSTTASVSIRGAGGPSSTTVSVTVRGTAASTTIASVVVMPSPSNPGSASATASALIAGTMTASSTGSVVVSEAGRTANTVGSVSVAAGTMMRFLADPGDNSHTEVLAIPVVLVPPDEAHTVASVHVVGTVSTATPASVSVQGSLASTVIASVTVIGDTLASTPASVVVSGTRQADSVGSVSIQGTGSQSRVVSVSVSGVVLASSPASVSVAETRTATAMGSVSVNGPAAAAVTASVTVGIAGSASVDTTASTCVSGTFSADVQASTVILLATGSSTVASVTLTGEVVAAVAASVTVGGVLMSETVASVALAGAGAVSVTASLSIDTAASVTASVVLTRAGEGTAGRLTLHNRGGRIYLFDRSDS